MRLAVFGIGSAMRTRARVYGDWNTKGVSVDLDSGAQANIVSKRLIKRLRLLPSSDDPLPTLEGVNGSALKCYGAYYISFSMADSRGVTRLITQLFYCIDRRQGAPDLLLSRPGMGQERIILDTATEEWWFGET